MSICFFRNGSQAATSSGSGLRFSGGRHLTTLADVNIFALEPHALGDDVGQQLPRPADERLALEIFVASRAFADKHQLGVRIADAENDIGPARAQLTALAIADRGAQIFQARRLYSHRSLCKHVEFGTSQTLGISLGVMRFR